ncbi:CPBP family intramembrane glutamic endopeptidase [cf. Phormidesmis sp. LEGE 11477]|uniref:CPBP family intramembrane glutamic endopeptidase n=1 Tax=cf. Phormidesmis sp. LEGE 11477 TaxID=1828680 RepID=UPI00188056EB|nr:type II CAAX endopeptidase family protein [cf. Phormidesmis sp. LEGE 11477]MBE9059725.1 CPBP family intramembrane metalloprotease [cf. Phormidesmis sp. LEGE 11477]
MTNPFLALRSRYLVLGAYVVGALGIGVGYGYLEAFQLLPWDQNDPLSIPIMSIAIWLVPLAVFWRESRQHGLSARSLFGQGMPQFSLLYAAGLVASALLFSLGSFSVFFYLLSLGFPGYAAQILESDLLGGGLSSQYPQLYNILMLFLLLVYAPLVEELIFRGFLLQRWASKWGLRNGLMASSLLFGVLHINNPVGLTLFGLLMGLLYVRSRSLWIPIGCHSLNNLAAVGIDRLSSWLGSESAEPVTVTSLQESWWTGLILIAIAAPFLWQFIKRSWPKAGDRIPYLLNAQKLEAQLKDAAE